MGSYWSMQQRKILLGINRIFREALVCQTEQELGKTCLRVAEKLTRSQFGFIGLIDAEGLLSDIAISDPGWNACRMQDQTGHRLSLPAGLKIHGLYGRVLRTAKGFFCNDPPVHPDSIGLPPGHPPLTAFIGIPLFDNDKVIGMIGLANRAGGYREDDLFALRSLSIAMVQALKRKWAETALRDSEELFRALFESTSVAMSVADPLTGRLLKVNKTYVNMLGYTSEEVVGRTFSELTHPKDREEDWKGFSRMVRGETSSYSVEKRLLHKDGRIVWCLVTVNLVRDVAEQPVRSVAVILDITDRRRVEEELVLAHRALLREQNFLKAVFDALPVGICITDEQGGILRVNQMDGEIWGNRPVTKGVADYHEYKAWWADTGVPVMPEEWASARAVQEGRTVIGQVIEIQRFDGGRRVINNSAAPVFDDNGGIIGSAISIQDVTPFWEMSKELIAAKNVAEEASRAKSEFLANMSHEIRTPMTVFMSAIEQLLLSDVNPMQRQLLDLADLASQRLYMLVNEVLDFSKIEAGCVKLEEEWFNLFECLQDTVALLTAKAHEKNLHLQLTLAPPLPRDILGDQYRLGQILLNLIGNAIKFTEEGEVKVTVRLRDDLLEFTVSDTGIGIPAEHLDKIFETFRQVDNSSTRSHGGSGLGLAITKGLVELMGGRIEVSSQIGQGSTFSFTLPVKTLPSQAQIRPEKNKDPVAVAAPGLRILLAEDDPQIRDVIQMALARRSWQITTAATGRDAVKKWQVDSFDVILMDLQMPHMDGLAATREIRRLEAGTGSKVGIIGLTAHADAAVERECLEAGMNEILIKPFESINLYAAIERRVKPLRP